MALHKFKYVSSECVERLLKQTIRFTQPDALNDPFEMKRFRESLIDEAPPEMWAAPAAAARVIMDQLLSHPLESPLAAATSALQMLLGAAFAQVRQAGGHETAAPATPPARAQPASDTEIALLRTKAKGFVGMMDRYGILSLAQHNDDLLMWAHYGDEHRGAVFEIDVEDAAFCASFRAGRSDDEGVDEWRGTVDYPDRRAMPPVSHAELIAGFFQKSPQWGYEHEYRIIRRLDKGTELPDATDRSRHPIYVFPLPGSCIKAVIFGARFDAGLRDRLADGIRGTPELAHVALSQAKLRLDIYGLEIASASSQSDRAAP